MALTQARALVMALTGSTYILTHEGSQFVRHTG
jgi:hypothetical protein